jgi:signal transduction histidine kinase
MTIAMEVGPEAAGVTVAQINLEFLFNEVRNITVGQAGSTYAVDTQGMLITHPNMNLVLKKTNLSALPQIQAARSKKIVNRALDLNGQAVLSAYSEISTLGWVVFVEQPKAEAYAALYQSLMRLGLLMIVGIILAIFSSMILVRKMMVPILALKEGANRIGSGSLEQRIEVKTGDELEELAEQFNHMATQLHESYANLEQKIEFRTREVLLEKEKVELARHHIALLSEIGLDITASLDQEGIMNSLYRQIHGLMDLNGFGIGFYRPEQSMIEFPFSIANDKRLPPYQRDTRNTRQLAVQCVLECKEIFIDDLAADAEQYQDQYDLNYECQFFNIPQQDLFRATIYVPLRIKDRVLGVISVSHAQSHAYQRFHLDMVRTLSAYAAVALDNAIAYDQLKSAQEKLLFQEKMVSLGTLTAGVAHEINNPANFAHVGAFNLKKALARFHQFLLELAGEDAPQDLLESLQQHVDALNAHLATISEGTVRIRDLVKDLRTFSRLDKAESSTMSIGESLLSTVSLVRMQYAGSTVIDCQLEADPILKCWPAQLNQVFMNLIVNACQAIENRQLSQPGPGLLRIRAWLDGQWLVIDFEDNGGGMSSATQAHVFEPFFTTKTVGEGMGMGLSISFGIIKKHQGTMELRSQEGQGSCFTLRLPLPEEEELV